MPWRKDIFIKFQQVWKTIVNWKRQQVEINYKNKYYQHFIETTNYLYFLFLSCLICNFHFLLIRFVVGSLIFVSLVQVFYFSRLLDSRSNVTDSANWWNRVDVTP